MSIHGDTLSDSRPNQIKSDGPAPSSIVKTYNVNEGKGHSKVDNNGGQGQSGQKFQGSKAWWSMGEFLHQGLTHQSVGLSLGRNDEETFDLGDSLADLYHAVTKRQRQDSNRVKGQGHSRSHSSGALNRDGETLSQDIRRWLQEDTNNGYIRVFASDLDTQSRLFPCTLSTSAQKICLQMGIPGNSLHVQLSGDVIRRMEPFDCPLTIQNKYLSGLGYSDIRFIQEEGPRDDLAHLVRFYAGKPLADFTYSRNQLSTYAYVRKGKLLHQWTRRRCVISGTRLFIHREKGAEPTIVQLARGSVEEVMVKGQSLVLKLTSTLQGERSLYLSFVTPEDYNKWLRKIRKATAKQPGKADLSNCHLEFLPENVFNNNDLEILILRHNALRERPIEEDIYTIGWLDDLHRFNCLRSLNLADNQLSTFPVSLTGIRSLVELNLASNKLEEVPPEIIELVNLQVLHLHNNKLSFLPEEVGQMKQLAVVVLAFNNFAHIPTFLLQSHLINCKVDSIIMAGNQISRLPAEHLPHMGHIRKIDLRLNRLQLMPAEMARFQSLERVTHLDIRENEVSDLDVRAMKELEYLNCEHNSMSTMQLNGSSLKNIFASHNCLQSLSVNPKPEWLVSMNVSHNKLTELPAWLSDCFFLVKLDVSYNSLTSLPARLFVDTRRLKFVKANHNRLTSLPEKIQTDTLEELYIQNNLLRQLPGELFLRATRLRHLNVTKNKLCDLPLPHTNPSYNKLQELYVSFNHLANRSLQKICCFPRLRVLHLAKNKLSVMDEMDIEKLEQLNELNLSSNNLTYLPSALGRHPKLQVLRANCNLLQELPNFKNSSALKVLEVSSNHLINVDMTNLMASQVSLLDISANPSILVKSHDLEMAKKRLCMLDMSGQNLSLEDMPSHCAIEEGGGQSWLTGLSLTSGIRNKLSVTAINKPHFGEAGKEALFAVFDGGRNETVAKVLCDVIPESMREERARSKNPEVYLKYSMLTAHRNLKSKGQKLGASAVVAHLHQDDQGKFILSVANVGDSQAVLCRQRKAYPLSRPFVVAEDEEDTRRVVNTGGIITEDGRVSGVTNNTRILGCSYLYPQVIPDPHVTSVAITSDDTVLIVANQGLWKFVSYEEAVLEIKDTPDPMMAVKRLQDLAQGYGSCENIAVLVARLMLSPEERSKARDMIRVQRRAQKELLKVLRPQENLLQLRDGVPKVEELSGVVIDKFGHAKKGRGGSKRSLNSVDSTSSFGSTSTDRISHKSTPEMIPAASAQRDNHASSSSSNFMGFSETLHKHGEDDGRSSSHYRKKTTLKQQSSIESNMRKRISEETKGKELQREIVPSIDKSKPSNDAEMSNEGNADHMDTGKNPSDVSNWLVRKPQDVSRAENPEDWEELLKRRRTQELMDKEMMLLTQDKEREDRDISDKENANWITQHQEANKESVEITLDTSLSRRAPKQTYDSHYLVEDCESVDSGKSQETITFLPQPPSRIDITSSNEIQPNQFYLGSNRDGSGEDIDGDDFEEGPFSVSPTESVSSIDLRLHNEADRIYSLRYLNPYNTHPDRDSTHVSQRSSVITNEEEILPPPPLFNDDEGNYFHTQMGEMERPMSPDSLISQDEFVKPPISTANIDRDALLFHQMQMARAQAHSGSVASLDSVQSAPLNPTSTHGMFPQARVSSHSIEVLVNIGENEDNSALGSMRDNLMIKPEDEKSGSTSTIIASKEKDLDTVIQKLESSIEDKQEAGKNIQGDESSVSNEDDEDKLTLVGDDVNGDIANLADLVEYNEDSDVNEETPLTTYHKDTEKPRSEVSVGFEPSTVVNSPSATALTADAIISESYDSDSDESIGDVSLGDGYSAMEYPTNIDRNGSISMLNVLESESDDYPQLLNFRSRKGSKGDKNAKLFTALHQKPRTTMVNGKHTDHNETNSSVPITASSAVKVAVNTKSPQKQAKQHKKQHKHSDDYEDIDFSDDSHSTGNGESIKEFSEKMSDYEEMQYLPKELTTFHSNIVESSSKGTPSEEDIDALYAKVNKIKMQKIQEKLVEPDNTIETILSLDSDSNTDSGINQPEGKKDNYADFSDRMPSVLKRNKHERPPTRPPLPPKPSSMKKDATFLSDPYQKSLSPQTNKNLAPAEPIGERRETGGKVSNAALVQTKKQTPSPNLSHKHGEITDLQPSTQNFHLKMTQNLSSSGAKVPSLPQRINSNPPKSEPSPPLPMKSPLPQPASQPVGNRSSPTDLPAKKQDFYKIESQLPGERHQKSASGLPPPPLPPKEPLLQSRSQKTHRPPPLPAFTARPQPIQKKHSQQQSTAESRNSSKKLNQEHQNHQHSTLHHHHLDHHHKLHDVKPNHHYHLHRHEDKPMIPPRSSGEKRSLRASVPSPSSSRKQPLSSSSSSQSSYVQLSPTHHTQSYSTHNKHQLGLPPGGARIAFPHVEDVGDDDFDSSVLSAHELYPHSHYPSSAPLPSPSKYPVTTTTDADVTASSRLPTQRSIIITYL